MTTVAWACLATGFVVMICDWWSVGRSLPLVESIAKPLVMACLMATVLATIIGSESTVDALPQWLALGALMFGLIGDLLLLPTIDRFIPGLAAFLIGHLLYVAAFVSLMSGTGSTEFSAVAAAAGTALAAALLLTVGRLILVSVKATRVAGPVALYVAVIAALIVTAFSTGRWWIGAGALVFAASDALLGHDRFVTPRTDRRVLVHASYHLGQAAIVYGILTS